MKKLLLLVFTVVCSLAFSQTPANDNCSGAVNLTLAAPGACGSGIKNGATTTIAGTNVNATPENPYNYQAGCSATAANNVWYSFVAPANGFGVKIVVSGGTGSLTNPQISLWSGSCTGFAAAGCASGAAGTATLSLGGVLVPGTTYYISISGADVSQSGAFTLKVNAFQDCSDCLNAGHITSTPLPVNGGYLPGQTVSFCYHVDQWTQANLNYLHGVQMSFGSGWDVTTLTTTAPPTYLSNAANNNNCSGTCGSWAYYPAGCTNASTGVHYGAGFYHNGSYVYTGPSCSCATGPNPGSITSGTFAAGGGDGSADVGDGGVVTPPANQWNFCWTIKVKNASCNPGSPLTVTVTTTGDGQSGDYSSLGCSGDQPILFNAIQACCPPSLATTTPVSCNGASTGAVTATAITGVSGIQDPYVFNWTGPSGPVATNTVSGVTTNTVSSLPAGTYTVVVTDKNLCAATSVITVSQPNPLTATLTPTDATCGVGGKITTTPGGGTAAYSYAWAGPSSYTSTAQSPTGLATGVYTLTLTDSKSCSYTATATIGQSATISAGIGSSATTGCDISNSFTFTNTGTTGITYAWDFGDATAAGSGSPVTHSYASVGTYTITETSTSGICTATAVATVTITSAPTLTLTQSTFTTCLNSPVTFTTSGASTYTWTPITDMTGSTTANPTVTPSTTTTTVYSVTGSANGCTSAANTVTLTVNPLPPATTYSLPTGPDTAYCQGAPIPLSVNSGTAIAVWYSNNIFLHAGSTYTPPANLPAGTYTYSVIDSIPLAQGGCINAAPSANTFTLNVTVNSLPSPPTYSVPTGPNAAYCQGAPTPLAVNSGTTIAVWYSNNIFLHAGSTYTPPANLPAGTYTYSVIDSIPAALGGCISAPPSANTLTLNVTVNSLPPATTYSLPTGTDTAYCQGLSIPLSVNSGTTIAVWYSNNIFIQSGSTYTPPTSLAAGTYTFSIIDSIPAALGGCTNALPSANTFTLSLTVNPLPTLDLTGAGSIDTANCGQSTGGVSNIGPGNVSGGTPTYNFQWFSGGQPIPGATSPVLSGQPAGTYSLQVTDANGCIANVTGGSSTFTVPSISQPTALFTTTPSPATGSIPLHVVFTNQSVNVSSTTVYLWTFGDGNGGIAHDTNYTYTNVGTYTATLIVANGSCKDTAKTVIIAEVPTTLIIPNVFTPNGDGANDVFFIINTGMMSLNCEIYNRWGQLLHTITAPNQGWDGIVPNGDKAPDGTYMYLLQAQGLDGKTYKQQGTISLFR